MCVCVHGGCGLRGRGGGAFALIAVKDSASVKEDVPSPSLIGKCKRAGLDSKDSGKDPSGQAVRKMHK